MGGKKPSEESVFKNIINLKTEEKSVKCKAQWMGSKDGTTEKISSHTSDKA